MKAIMNWSGGKDSTLTLYKVLAEGSIEVHGLFTTISHELRRITMHGVREELLDAQAAALGIPLYKLELPASDTMDAYNQLMQENLEAFKAQGVTHALFGDIYLEDLKAYRETELSKVDIKGIFPLWKLPVKEIITTFIEKGFKAIIVCVSARYLDKSFLGRTIDADFLNDLPENVDICGENGEFHTFVYDGPLFKNPIPIKLGQVVYKDYSNGKEDLNYDTGFYFQEILLEAAAS